VEDSGKNDKTDELATNNDAIVTAAESPKITQAKPSLPAAPVRSTIMGMKRKIGGGGIQGKGLMKGLNQPLDSSLMKKLFD
jgi:hypothetical protein